MHSNFPADDPILIRRTRDPFGWMGNMSPFPVVYKGTEFRTTEALFQALRFAPGSPVIELIRVEKSPMAAKLVAKKHTEQMVVENLSKDDLANMITCLTLKLEQHPNLKDRLLETGDRIIIEDVTKRREKGTALFWGAALEEDGTWTGTNALGKCWMKLRVKLREQEE